MAEPDFDRINVLLQVVHQCASAGPQLTAINNAAMDELRAINEDIKNGNVPINPEPIPEPDDSEAEPDLFDENDTDADDSVERRV